MLKVNVAELKTRLGRYLQKVRDGETIAVTSHSHAIARIIPYEEGRKITIIEPTRPIKELKEVKSAFRIDVVDGVKILLEDRSRR